MLTQRITSGTIRQMQRELDEIEARARQEVKIRKTRALGLLRMDLVQECRRKLVFMSLAVKRSRQKSAANKFKV